MDEASKQKSAQSLAFLFGGIILGLLADGYYNALPEKKELGNLVRESLENLLPQKEDPK